ncbi:winged helix-turn-helix domain-containing protein [Phenylobacterium sp.]|uniref:ATP-binding protein n=1 Tax=Phenylobacterium sp. TaxID=1871053 RepID=UPI0012291C56|nr:winged helix-turn-helix domain-containing protein [Phenylobacterium sp.]THD54651.1 MAG: hypothetical protein E8A12_16845 [Phenylobacterium sp.]
MIMSMAVPREGAPASWMPSHDPREPGTAPLAAADRSNRQALVFGRFRFVVHSRELTADGVPVPIGNRALEVFSVLIEARGDLVTKDELLSRVWPTTTVEENNLQFQISTLRKALGADRGLIKTLSGRGYRFIAEVGVESHSGPSEWRNARLERDGEPGDGAYEAAASNNLPAPTSEIVGREPHLSDVAAMVEANRLVTLVGAGGIGKTRLAVELARRLSPAFDGGVRVVELAPLADPALVRSAVGAVLGLGDDAASAARIASALGSKRMLLVLDNCEHVIQAAASVAEELLHADARLHLIATSREPLRADGEWIYRVPPLEVPPEDADGLDEVMQYSAAKLFMDRTRAADSLSRFDGLAAAAALICRQLDGIPLAIELAAARAATLGVEELAARVSDRLGLLTDGRRTAPARHRTLRATLDWSYELLTEPERIVMRRLAVFGGDFTLEAATYVVGVGEVADTEVVENLASLVAKSLVAADVRGPTYRYRLLGTMRDYAMDKLAESGEFDAVSSRHLGVHQVRFDRAAPKARGGSEAHLLEA